jgi:LmbE family N-acetylglucosaminyl deacetylase
MAKKWVKAGYEVRFLSMCNGCGGHHIMTPEETVARRARESAAVAEYLGIRYDIWDIDDCTLMADLPTRMRLIRYIREFSPDLIIDHRTNDYHADHRASAQLVADASYILTVPHTCPDVPAMRRMPVIVYNEDRFKNPEFNATYVVDMDGEIDTKLHIAHLNESQVYEWLPYTHEQVVPEGEAERFEWLKGMQITADTTDSDIMAASSGYAVRFAKTAARFRRKLIEKYGEECGSMIRYAEAFELSEYGRQPDEALAAALFGF